MTDELVVTISTLKPGCGYEFCICEAMAARHLNQRELLYSNPKELLTHIILTAKRSGFLFKNFLDDYDSFIITSFNAESGRMAFVLRNESQLRVVYDSVYALFFDTTFAKALFGEEWESKLVDLASANDKLKFLSDHILIQDIYA